MAEFITENVTRIELWSVIAMLFLYYTCRCIEADYSNAMTALNNVLNIHYTGIVDAFVCKGKVALVEHQDANNKYQLTLESVRTGEVYCASVWLDTVSDAKTNLGLQLLSSMPVVLLKMIEEIKLYGPPPEDGVDRSDS